MGTENFNEVYAVHADLPILGKIGRFVPKFLRPLINPLWESFARTIVYKKLRRKYYSNPISQKQILGYWSNPQDAGNTPEAYLERTIQSEFLLSVIKPYVSNEMRILEIGCNVGRNLNYLFEAGFRNLEGVEINKNAVALLKQSYPDMARQTKIHVGSIEGLINGFPDNYYDLVFTVAVLYHIHNDSEWIFRDMVRISNGLLITIECEYATTDWRHFPRNYKTVFEQYGMKCVNEIDCSKNALVKEVYGDTVVARVFKRLTTA
jgi:SAM-dependent methyltransferase